MRREFEGLAAPASERIMNWIAARVDPARRDWVEAMRAELCAIDGGWNRLAWALGGFRLLWVFGRTGNVIYGQRGFPALGSVCVSGAVLAGVFWFMFVHHYPANSTAIARVEGVLAVYLFATGFLAGPARKGFVAGAWIGLASAILGVFGGFVMWSEGAWINPLYYVIAGAIGMLFGGLGGIARSHLSRTSQPIS
jgi:hypothetical protein